MRILEQCTAAWPMPEMQAQIDALREAFSADINKPFELRHTFPYGSPGAQLQPSPPIEMGHYPPTLSRDASVEQLSRASYVTQPITPPISAGHGDAKSGSPGAPPFPIMTPGQGQHQPMPQSISMVDTIGWNPTRIFE